ncbi:unnamed protein product, partial [Mesorhabditis spiculigera]
MHFQICVLSLAFGLSICCCPAGYYTVRDNPACFTFLKAKNFEDGVQQCRNASGIPYKISNIFVNKNLYLWSNSSTRVIADEYYLGIRRRDEVWLYWDGSSVDYLHWGPGQPAPNSNNLTNSAAMPLVRKSDGWITVAEIRPLPFLCGHAPEC